MRNDIFFFHLSRFDCQEETIIKNNSINSSRELITLQHKTNSKMVAEAGDGQCEVVLVGCGAPKRGMGWYHAEQLNKGKCPSAKLCFIVEPWFLGGGKIKLAFLHHLVLGIKPRHIKMENEIMFLWY